MSEVIDIASLFKTCADRVNAFFSTRAENPFNVYFESGHYDAVNKTLVQKGESLSFKNQKFPLVWMITPFEQKTNASCYCELSGLDFLIITTIKEGESLSEQTENRFKNYLWPIREQFKSEIEASGFFNVLSADAIPMDYEKDWHYQSGLSGKNNLFNDQVVATQMKGVRLHVNEALPEKIFF